MHSLAITPRIPLAVSFAGLEPGESVRERLSWAASCGFRGVALDAANTQTRPRELGSSARRDLAAVLRRHELTLAGIDLWIPAAHFVDPARCDRAIESAVQAIDLASELAPLAGGRALVSVSLPRGEGAGRAAAALAGRAAAVGAIVADHAVPIDDLGLGPRWIGIDPAAIIVAGQDPAAALMTRGEQVAAARLSDIDAGGRVEPGAGRLDSLAYVVGVSMRTDLWPAIVDLRGVREQDAAARRILERWASVE